MRALESVRSQSFSGPITCIVSENGQSRNTREVFEAAASSSPEIRWKLLQSREVSPPPENWLRALKEADSRWVKILWDDDWMESTFLETTVKAAERNDVSVVTVGATTFSTQGPQQVHYCGVPAITTREPGEILRLFAGLGVGLPVSPAAALLDRHFAVLALEASRKSGVCFERAMGPDLALILEGALAGKGLTHVPDPLVNMWMGQDSITVMSSKVDLRLCYDHAILMQARRHGVAVPRDVRRRLQHRAFVAVVRRNPMRSNLISVRPQFSQLATNFRDHLWRPLVCFARRR